MSVSLKRRGIDRLNEWSNVYHCRECGQGWSVNQPPGGERFPPRWWLCPNRCNADAPR